MRTHRHADRGKRPAETASTDQAVQYLRCEGVCTLILTTRDEHGAAVPSNPIADSSGEPLHAALLSARLEVGIRCKNFTNI